VILFGSADADANQPRGLFFNANAAIPAHAAGASAIQEDIAALVASVAKVSNNGPVALIGNPGQAARLAVDRTVSATYPIFATAALPARTVAAVALNALVVAGADEPPRYEVATDATLHMEDTSPAAISTPPATVAAPVVSLYQSDLLALRMVWSIDWALRSADGVAYIADANWGAQA
jgi:hypothetical protein